jgi:phosphoenolpyruvate-protein kinase (PTS system EI component)
MGDNWWVLIPVIAILAGSFTEWAKLNAKQRKLGSSTDELEEAVSSIKQELKAQQQSLERRIANLETIVTSQTWDVLHDSKLNSEEKKLLTQSFRSEIEELNDGLSDTRKVELLVGRLK